MHFHSFRFLPLFFFIFLMFLLD
ncbi:CRISPR-associated DxTHG motif protein [Mesomycoplasma ovipneumoniae]